MQPLLPARLDLHHADFQLNMCLTLGKECINIKARLLMHAAVTMTCRKLWCGACSQHRASMRKGAAELAEKQSEMAGMQDDLRQAQQDLAACREEALRTKVCCLHPQLLTNITMALPQHPQSSCLLWQRFRVRPTWTILSLPLEHLWAPLQEEVTLRASREAELQQRITLLSQEARSSAESHAPLDGLTDRQEAATAALKVRCTGPSSKPGQSVCLTMLLSKFPLKVSSKQMLLQTC